jgi:hypothetical protein
LVQCGWNLFEPKDTRRRPDESVLSRARHPTNFLSQPLRGGRLFRRFVSGRVVGGFRAPARPDDAQPSPADGAQSVGVALSAGACRSVALPGPLTGSAAVIEPGMQSLARRLVACRNATVWVLPGARVIGARPVSAASWSKLVARSRIGPTSPMIWARFSVPMLGRSAAPRRANSCLAPTASFWATAALLRCGSVPRGRCSDRRPWRPRQGRFAPT